jgi:hypothetical protein
MRREQLNDFSRDDPKTKGGKAMHKKSSNSRLFQTFAFGALCFFLVIGSVSWAAEVKPPKYPAKGIDAVVPFAPGAG